MNILNMGDADFYRYFFSFYEKCCRKFKPLNINCLKVQANSLITFSCNPYISGCCN